MMTSVDVTPEKMGRSSIMTSSSRHIDGMLIKINHLVEVSSTNNIAQRVFRSFQAIRCERQRQRRESRFIIHPFSLFRWYWDIIMVITLGTTLLVLPIEVAFYSDDEGHTSSMWMAINIIVDVIFLIDIVFNFRTGYVHQGVDQVEINSKKVAMHYVKTWFALDLISSIPLDYLYQACTGGNLHASFYLTFRILRFTKLLSLLRILRMARLVRYIYRIEELLEMEGKLISMVNLIMIIFVFCHWNGCLQYLSAFLEGFPEDSWAVTDRLVNITGNHTERLATTWTMYTRSLWRAMSHMLSIGYGSKPPVTNTDTWMVIISMMLGASFYALFIASMSGLIMSMDLSGKKYDEMIAEVKQYMRFRRVPMNIQHRVLEYYDHKYQRKYFDENTILYEPSMLSHNLRQDILLHNCRPLVAKVPFLSSAPQDFLYDIIQKLQFQVFFPKDLIIQAGKKGDSMYFIEHGLVDVQLANGKVVNSLGDGSYFGEISLLLEERRVATIVAVEICDTYCLKKVDFDDVLQEYPEMKLVLERIAKQRMSQLNTGEIEVSENSRANRASMVTATLAEDIIKNPQIEVNLTDEITENSDISISDDAGVKVTQSTDIENPHIQIELADENAGSANSKESISDGDDDEGILNSGVSNPQIQIDVTDENTEIDSSKSEGLTNVES